MSTPNLSTTADAIVNFLEHQEVCELRGKLFVVTLQAAVEYVVKSYSNFDSTNDFDPQVWMGELRQEQEAVPSVRYTSGLDTWQWIFPLGGGTFADSEKNYARALAALWIEYRITTGGYWIPLLDLGRMRYEHREALLAAHTAGA